MKWYFAKGGSQQGPVDSEELSAKIAAGEVAPSDLVWREGMKDWVPAAQVSELKSYGADGSGGAAAPAPAAGGQAAAAGSPYGAPVSAPAGAGGPGMVIPNYLWQSIVVTILCCWPFGIPAIVFAAKVDGLVARGQYAEAREASGKAKTWCWVSFGSWFVAIALYIVLIVFSVALES